MTYTPAQARANDKWDKENMTRFNCKISKADGEKFRALVAANGDTVNGVLCAAIRDYIAANDTEMRVDNG